MKGRRGYTAKSKVDIRMVNLEESKKRRKKDLHNCVFCAAMILIILWWILSWLEVITHNLDPDYEYNILNLFRMITGGV